MTTIDERVPLAVAPMIGRAGLDAALILSPQGFTHVTGWKVPTQLILPWRFAAALVTPDGLDSVLVVDMEATTAAAELPGVPLFVWREFEDNAMEQLARMVQERLGAGPLRLGIETNFVPVGAARRLGDLLPEATWEPCESHLAKDRLTKTPAELARIKALADASDVAVSQTFDAIKVGDHESDISRNLVGNLYAQGVQEHACLIVATGERSQYPNVGPSDRRVAAGDVVRLEIFGGRNGYRAGVARTAVIGEPDPELASLWEVLAQARSAGLAALAPGADAAAVYRAYVDALGPLRPFAISFFGHGMGLDLHEPPYLSAESVDPLVEGAILGIEPFAMIPGKYGLQVKDVVSLGGGGCTILSDRLDGGVLHVIDG